MQEFQPFFSPIFLTRLETIDTEKIVSEIFQIKNLDEGKKMSNVGGWQSKHYQSFDYDFLDETKKLMFEINKLGHDILKNKYELPNAKENFANFWCNVNEFQNFNLPHTHPGTVLSGVFYLRTPPNSGKIIFCRQDPQEHYIPQTYNEYTFKTFFIEPSVGDLIFFPSYLTHYVEQNFSNLPRISLAFDF